MSLSNSGSNDIIKILNNSVESIGERSNSSLTSYSSQFSGRTCLGCNRTDAPSGPIVIGKDGCIGSSTNNNLPSITLEELGDFEFAWAYCGGNPVNQEVEGLCVEFGSNGIVNCSPGHVCDFTNFKLFINDVFVTNFDFNNMPGNHGYGFKGFGWGGRIKLKDLPNSNTVIDDIIKRKSVKSCDCGNPDLDCRRLQLEIKITAVIGGSEYKQHVAGAVQFKVKDRTWRSCLPDAWKTAWVFPESTLTIGNAFNTSFCICQAKKRRNPPANETETMSL
jgi:hypothetical protein